MAAMSDQYFWELDIASFNQLQRYTMDILNRQSEFFYLQWDYHTEVQSAFHPLWSVLRNDLLNRLIDRSVSSGVALECHVFFLSLSDPLNSVSKNIY